jgi:hypothetical protein
LRRAHGLDCSQPEPLWLQAQAVPSASLIPCVRTSPGWSVADATARNGWSGFTLDHDRAGRGVMVVRLTPACDPVGATEAHPSGPASGTTSEPGASSAGSRPPGTTGSRVAA